MVILSHDLGRCTCHLRVVIRKLASLEVLTLLLLTSGGLMRIVIRDVVLVFLKLGSLWLRV